MSGRDDILGGIRRALGRGPVPAETAAALAERVAAHRRNLVPARAAALGPIGRVDLFVKMAEEVQTTVTRVTSDADIPAEVARYLAAENLPAELTVAPDSSLNAIPWQDRPLLQIRRGKADPADQVSLTPCLAAVAETGTLMLVSGSGTPTTLNFLPDTHIVVVRASQVVAGYEDGWDLIRACAAAGEGWPRTVNMITGPSRTGDIEQRIQLGAHGPRRLHIVLVGEPGESLVKRRLSLDEIGLWRRAMHDVVPLRGHPSPWGHRQEPPPAPLAPAVSQPAATRTEKPRRPASAPPAVPLPPLDRFAGIDRASAERLKRGRYIIEARLDLHGMTQDEAHAALARFIGVSRALGRRCVLIITGHGRISGGVLKTAVPRWLNEPDFRRDLLAVTAAQPRDGGSAALYLLLRRTRDTAPP